jgi:hypothetical protein
VQVRSRFSAAACVQANAVTSRRLQSACNLEARCEDVAGGARCVRIENVNQRRRDDRGGRLQERPCRVSAE